MARQTAAETARSAAKTARAAKPSKPYSGFPLFAHATGRWAKKIRGRFVFFGPWADPVVALARCREHRDRLFVIVTVGKCDSMIGSSRLDNSVSNSSALSLRESINHIS